MTGAITSTGRPPVYKWPALLPFLLENRPRRLCDVVKTSRWLLGISAPRGTRQLVTNAVQQLAKQNVLQLHKTDILPKRRPAARKGAPYARMVMTLECRQGQNHVEGRYEAMYSLNSALPLDFVARLKHDCAAFFGFGSWFEGLIGPGWRYDAVMRNARASYAHKLRTQTRWSAPNSMQLENSNTATGYAGAPTSEVEADQALMNQRLAIPRQGRDGTSGPFGRKTAKLLERYGALSRATMRGEQENQAVSGASPPGRHAKPGTRPTPFLAF